MFSHKSTAVCGTAAEEGGTPYVFSCALSCDGGTLAASLSTCMVKCYDPATLRQTGAAAALSPAGAPPGSHRVVSIDWSVSTPSLLYAACGSSDDWDEVNEQPRRRAAAVHALDTRSGQVCASWDLHGAAAQLGDLGAMACSPSGTLLAVGLGPAVCFVDARRASSSSPATPAAVLGSFAESHSQSVTSLAWHPVLHSHALSGGEDGLVNVYDVSVSGGDEEALVGTLNVEDSVSHFGVFGASGALVHVATRTGVLSLWNLGGACKVAEFTGLRDGLPGFDFLLSTHYNSRTDKLLALAGSHSGGLHVLDVSPTTLALRGSLPASARVGGGHSAAARCAAADRMQRALYTGGEDGRLCQWVVGGGEEAPLGSAKVALGSAPPAAGTDEASHFGKRKAAPRK